MNSIGAYRYIAAFASALLWTAAGRGAPAVPDCEEALSAQERVARFKAADHDAEERMHARQFERAVALYKQAVCLVPDSARGWYGLGVAQSAAGLFRDARASLATADRLQPSTPMPLIMRVRADAALRDEPAMRESLRELARRFPDDANAHATVARFLTEQSLFDLALAESLRAEKAAPADAISKLQLAGLENTAGAYADAARMAEAVVRQDQAPAEMRAAAAGIAGLSYESLGKTDDAVRYMKEAVMLDPAQENSYLALADLYDKLQRFGDAVDLLEQARRKLPNATAILLPLGTDLIRTERYREGVAVIHEVIARAPETEEAYLRLADAAHRTGNATEEVRALEQLQQRRPNYPMIDVLIARAMLAEEHVDYAAVLSRLAMAERKAAGDPDVFSLRGRVYMATERYAEAVAPLQRSIELRPLDPANYYQLARVYQKLGKADLARACFERLRVLDTRGQ